MACFIVPGIEAVITTAIQKAVGKERAEKLKFGWLSAMLWGGTALLAVEHIWHGEVVPWPPFLTAMKNPAEIAPMLHETATVGTAMALTMTFVWLAMIAIASAFERKATVEETKVRKAKA